MNKDEIVDQIRDILKRKREMLEKNKDNWFGLYGVLRDILQKDIIALEYALQSVDNEK